MGVRHDDTARVTSTPIRGMCVRECVGVKHAWSPAWSSLCVSISGATSRRSKVTLMDDLIADRMVIANCDTDAR
jgi:hypothetical protein